MRLSNVKPLNGTHPYFCFFLVAVIGLVVRLIFIFKVSTIPVIWDAEVYWNQGGYIRRTICVKTAICSSDTGIQMSSSQILDMVVLTRSGLLPVLIGGVTSIFPADPRTVYVLFAIFDAIICWLIAHVVRLLGLPFWTAVASGLLFALYIPAATGTGASLQQPLIRFGIAVAVWAYTLGFSLTRNRYIYLCALIGTAAAIAIGFSSITTRPLMWLIPAVVIVLAWRSNRKLAYAQGMITVATIGIFLAFVGSTVALQLPNAANLLSPLFTGLSSSGGDPFTIYSYPHFWPATNLEGATSIPLLNVIQQNPVQFMAWWVNSIFSNWRYPDFLYFQEFVLSIDAQKVVHVFYVVAGIIGLMWIIGQKGIRQNVALLICAIAMYLCVSYGLISVEPRRMVVLSPFLALGMAVALWLITSALTKFTKRSVSKFGLLSVVATGIVWLLTPAAVLQILPVSPLLIQQGLLLSRFLLTLWCGILLLRFYKREITEFRYFWAAVILVPSLVILIWGLQQDPNWHEWQTTLRQGMVVRQTVTGFEMDKSLSPWLLLDMTPDAKVVEVTVNGTIVKRSSDPVYVWEAGIPPQWGPYTSLIKLANVSPTRSMWQAISIPRSLISENMTVEITLKEGDVRLNGDYSDSPTSFAGPLLDPWYSGHSLWKWIWNGNEPRIEWPQTLNGSYISSVSSPSGWHDDDLSEGFGIQKGTFRIFFTLAEFGPNNDALTDTEVANTPNNANQQHLQCKDATWIAGKDGQPFICRTANNTLAFYNAAGNQLGETPDNIFTPLLFDKSDSQMAYRAESLLGTVEVLRATDHVYVANFYSDSDTPSFSLTFPAINTN